MPLTAIGRYEATVVLDTDSGRKELASAGFHFVPLRRIVGVAALAALLIMAAIQPWRFSRARTARWLALPLAAGLGVFSLCSGDGSDIELVSYEMIAFALFMGTICSMRGKNRTAALLAGAVIGMLVCYAGLSLSMIKQGDFSQYWSEGLGVSAIGAGVCYLPTVFALVAVRHRFSWPRLLAGLVVSLLLVNAAGAVAYSFFFVRMQLLEGLAMTGMSSPFSAAFFVFAVFNPWCREGLIRVWGLDREKTSSACIPSDAR